MSAPKLHSVPDAAELMGCSENHVYRLIASGDLRCVDVSLPGSKRSKTRVREDDIEAWIKSRTRSAKRLRVAT